MQHPRQNVGVLQDHRGEGAKHGGYALFELENNALEQEKPKHRIKDLRRIKYKHPHA